jgi:methyl-accepting chemotaxis protein
MKFRLLTLDTINKKFLLPVMLFVTLLIGALGGVLVVQQHRELTSMMESKSDSFTTMLATIAAPYVDNYDSTALEGFVKETTKDQAVAFAEYYDAEGKSLTSNVMKAPADVSQLLVYERNILGANGKMLGKVKVGYKTSALDRMLQQSITIVLGSLVVVLGLLAFGLLLIVRTVASPLKHAITIARHVADGNLTQRIEVNSKDEAGQLLQALKDMNESLADIVGDVRKSSNSIII